jgi:eukaryotic translation initiation factor 2C
MMDPHDELPPPPPLPPNVVPIKVEDVAKESPSNKLTKPTRLPTARPGLGKKGQPIQLLANHFKVSVKSSDDFFHHYYVSICYPQFTTHNLARHVISLGLGPICGCWNPMILY